MPALDELASAVLASPKNRWLCPDTVRRIGERELAKGRGLKAAVKATKSRLHQIFGAFDRAPDYDRLLAELGAGRSAAMPPLGEVLLPRASAPAGGYARGTLPRVKKPAGGAGASPVTGALRSAGFEDAFRAACRSALACHASTRERLPILDRFYAEIFAITGRPGRVLDLACGLHPLGLPWMGLAPDATYTAYDIDARSIAFLNRFFAGAAINSRAILQDILCQPPDEPADVAFLLKTLPCLERQERGASGRLLGTLRARHVVVSFPVASLGGRGKGMRENYERDFTQMAKGAPWQIERLEFPTELVFVVKK